MVEQVGSVADLHGLDPFADGPPARPVVWWCRPTDDAIVLGSRQPASVVDSDACARAGLAVVRRRSGGGAVLLDRRSILWLDVLAPHGWFPDDVRASMRSVGTAWRHALDPWVDTDLRVHDGGMIESPWSELVCFSGIGPGEVIAGDGKLVGLSQRRTRHGVRVQCLVNGDDMSDRYRGLLRPPLPPGDPGGQASFGSWAGIDTVRLVEAVADRISRM